jgi:two-component system sporulation sensor kinase B
MIVVYSFVVIVAAYISPRYFYLKRRDKFLVNATITIIGMILMFFSTYLMNLGEDLCLIDLIAFFLLFTIIKILALHFTIYVLEGFVEKRELRIELQRVDRLNTVGGLAASIAHEIRNPLTVAKGFMQLIQKNGDKLSKENLREYLEMAITETNRAEKVIADFLSFANPSVEKQSLINVSDLVSLSCNIMYSYATLNNISINKTLESGCYLITDENKLTQVFVNIIKNSIEAMPEGGVIDVRVFKDRKNVFIEIEDYGIGMTKEEIFKLGTPFYSLKTSGTGLGLMISYKYVQILGGKIKVESEKGKGTKFILIFPIYDKAPQEDTNSYISE